MNNYWKNKNVFITGINGFVGGNLAKKLLDLEANVIGLIRNKDENSLLFFENINKKIILIDGDITNKNLISGIISEQKIDHVFHFAAQVEVGVAMKNPYFTYETNTRGTYSLLDAIRSNKNKIMSIVVASTDKSYGSYNKDEMPYKEYYPLRAKYPYDVSKACADMISQSYASEPFKLPIVITRFANIYGPGQLNFSALIPDAIRSALGYTNFYPRGNGKQIRDYIFIDDVVDVYLKISHGLATKPRMFSGQIFNAGTKKGYSVNEILKIIYGLCGSKIKLKKINNLMRGKKTIGEIETQYMDFEKLNKFTAWQPRFNMNKGIKKTIIWYKNYLRKTNKK